MKHILCIVTIVMLMCSIGVAAENSGFVVNIKNDLGLLHEDSGIVYIPFNSEYSILLKNTTNRRCSARVYIDGEQVSPSGDFVIDTGDELDLERFVNDLNKCK